MLAFDWTLIDLKYDFCELLEPLSHTLTRRLVKHTAPHEYITWKDQSSSHTHRHQLPEYSEAQAPTVFQTFVFRPIQTTTLFAVLWYLVIIFLSFFAYFSSPLALW